MSCVAYYFMIGCPHCEKNKSAWEQAKKKAEKMGMTTKEIESKDSPSDVRSFPTTRLEEDDGTPTGKKVEGSRKTGDEILTELGVEKKKGGKRKTRKQQRRRSRHRTLRNHVAFV